MAANRKLWETRFDGVPAMNKRHQSESATYRYVSEQADAWVAGILPWQFLNVFVDERDGRGWQHYERLDLAEVGSS